MSEDKFTKFDIIFSVNKNIKCLDTRKDNKFKLRNNKIYFENNHIDKKIDTDVISVYKSSFTITTDDDSLMFGINNLDETINDNGYFLVKTKFIDNNKINFYKNNVTLNISSKIKNTKFYVIDSNNKMYEIPLVYNELCREESCINRKHQTYVNSNLGQEINLYQFPNLTNEVICSKAKVYRIRKQIQQQNLYSRMRLYPHLFPIISKVQNLNLTMAQKRAYSNMWWRQFGTSQALPVNDNFGGFNLVGSDVRYTS